MEILPARYLTAAAFLDAYDETLPHGGLMVPSTRFIPPGTAVVVELVGRLLPEHVLLRAVVVAVRAARPRQQVSAGVLVAFPPEERAAVEYVLGLVRGVIPARRRRQAPRLPVALAARCRVVPSREPRAVEVVDISTGGLALRIVPPPPVAATLVVELLLPAAVAPLELEAEVVVAAAGRVGARFARNRNGGLRRLREIMRRLRAA